MCSLIFTRQVICHVINNFPIHTSLVLLEICFFLFASQGHRKHESSLMSIKEPMTSYFPKGLIYKQSTGVLKK